MRMLTHEDADQARHLKDSFMDFWRALNDELARQGAKEAFFGDAHDMFSQWRPIPSATEAALQLMRVRGDR